MTSTQPAPGRDESEQRLIGVDLGGTFIKWVHLAAGAVVDHGSVPTPTSGADEVADAIADIGRGQRATRLGVAVPGHLTQDMSATTLLPNVAGSWDGFPLAARLAAATGAAVQLTNDARAFATAELTAGAARDCPNAVFVTMGTGIGGAVALHGRVLHGPGDKLGEIGHTVVNPGGAVCSCGYRGCLETLAGGRNMAAAWAALDTMDDRAGAGPPARSPAELVAAARAGQPAALAVLNAAGAALGLALGNVLGMLGFQVAVIGGGVAPAFEFMESATLHALVGREYLTGPIQVRPAALGPPAGAIGAALSAAYVGQPI